MSCSKSPNAKYANRPGPPYPAQNCKSMRKVGNDGLLYVSKPDKNGIYKWYKVSSGESKKVSRKKSKKISRKKSRNGSKKKSRKRSKNFDKEFAVLAYYYNKPKKTSIYAKYKHGQTEDDEDAYGNPIYLFDAVIIGDSKSDIKKHLETIGKLKSISEITLLR
jgi:hypothetical protein